MMFVFVKFHRLPQYYCVIGIKICCNGLVVHEKSILIIGKAVVVLHIFQVRRILSFYGIALDNVPGNGSFQGFLLLFDGALSGVFNSQNDAQLSALAEQGMRLYFLFLPFMGINSVFSVYYTSCEKPLLSQVISLLRGTILVIPLAFSSSGCTR